MKEKIENASTDVLREIIDANNIVSGGLQGTYMTLQQLDIKATPSNTKYLFAVYQEIEKMLQITKRIQQVGDESVEREREQA